MASLYAVVRSDCAPAATGSAAWIVPFTFPGGKPVTAIPGLTPRSPLIVEEPVFVTVEPARTAKLSAVPRPTDGCAASASLTSKARTTKPAASAAHTARQTPLPLPPGKPALLPVLESVVRTASV